MNRDEERARRYAAGADTSHSALIEEIRDALEITGDWEVGSSEIRIITRWTERPGLSSDGGDYTRYLVLRQVGNGEWLVYPDWSAIFAAADWLWPGCVYPQAIGFSTMVKIVEKLAGRVRHIS